MVMVLADGPRVHLVLGENLPHLDDDLLDEIVVLMVSNVRDPEVLRPMRRDPEEINLLIRTISRYHQTFLPISIR